MDTLQYTVLKLVVFPIDENTFSGKTLMRAASSLTLQLLYTTNVCVYFAQTLMGGVFKRDFSPLSYASSV